MEFLAHNKTLSEFASMTGRPKATIADWRKRDFLDVYGRPHPNNNGHYIYSSADALAVYIAEKFVLEGMKWKSALKAAHFAAGQMIGRHMYPDQDFYQNRFLILFEFGENIEFSAGSNVEPIFDQMTSNLGLLNAPMGRVLDLHHMESQLPEKYKLGLASLERELE